MEQSMRLLVIAAGIAFFSVCSCTSTRTASTNAPPAGAPVSVPSDTSAQSIRPAPTAPAQPAVSSGAAAGTTSSGAVEPAAGPQSTSSATSATAAKSKSPAEHPGKQAGEGAPPRPTAAAAASDRAPAPPTLNLADLEQRLRDTHAIGVFTKLSLKNQVDDLLNEFRALYKGADKHPTAELRQQYDLLLLKVLSLLQDGDPSLAAAISSSREAIWGILSDPDKFAKI
jgi:hypothetical protein